MEKKSMLLQTLPTLNPSLQKLLWEHSQYGLATKIIMTNHERPIATDLRHLSPTASNITAKLTNQFIQIGLRTFD